MTFLFRKKRLYFSIAAFLFFIYAYDFMEMRASSDTFQQILSDNPFEKGFLGGHAGSELLNVVGGRTSLISGLLFDSPFQRVPVRGALVFEASPPGWFDGPFNLAGIAVTTPKDLIDSLFTPLHLDADTRRRVAEHLLSRF